MAMAMAMAMAMTQHVAVMGFELKAQHLQQPWWRRRRSHSTAEKRYNVFIQCSSNRYGGSSGSPKTGSVGSQRLKEGALPGTYWNSNAELGGDVRVAFNKGTETVIEAARVGENLLRVAERCGAMVPNPDFCFEGSCCHCEMEVVGGASEVSSDASHKKIEELVRGCICAVPMREGCVQVNMINEEDVWGDQVL